MEEGIIRVGGRLQNANISAETKYPIVLPKDGHFTELVIQEAHEKTGHSVQQLVHAELRKRFWIVKGASSVRKVIGRCVVCRRHRNPETQKMANLPAERVAFEPAFTHTGIDYFGPFYVKQNRSQAKRYGVIFTCLSVRAVHSCGGKLRRTCPRIHFYVPCAGSKRDEATSKLSDLIEAQTLLAEAGN